MHVRRATIKDVATHAGVSAATVSNVMLGRRGATAEVADRVRASAAALGYVADRSASQLRSGRAKVVTVLVPNLTDPFFAGLIAALERITRVEGFDIIVGSSCEDDEIERHRLATLLSWKPSGVVVVPHRDDIPNRAAIEALRLPYVVLDRAAPDLPADAVVAANREATAEAAAHLLDHGHRDILVVSSTSRFDNIRERFAGVADAFAARGLPRPPSLDVGLTFEAVAERMAVWLAANPRPTAFLTVTNFLTMGVLAHLGQAGLSVPRDVSLIGFDDYPWMRAVSPAITAIRQDVTGLAEQTWALLRARMDDRAAAPKRVTVPCRFVVRDSVRRIGPPVLPVPVGPARRPRRRSAAASTG